MRQKINMLTSILCFTVFFNSEAHSPYEKTVQPVIDGQASPKTFTLKSPDQTIVVSVAVDKAAITYQVAVDGKTVVYTSEIGLKTSMQQTNEWKVRKTKQTSVNQLLKPVVWQKSNTIADIYNRLQIDFQNGLSLVWQAYNNGVAWRWVSSHKGVYKIESETASFAFQPEGQSWFPEENGFLSGNERFYQPYVIQEIDGSRLASLPALFESHGIKVLLTESDLWNYAGMWLRGDSNGVIRGDFPKYPKTKKEQGNLYEHVTEREAYIAELNGAHSFPWRILMIARTDNELLTNQLVYQLARPATGDFSWVRPGKAQWDWWHANNLYGVDFKVGMNTETHKYYIDFAAANHIEYILIDAGWSNYNDLLEVSPAMDMEALVAYGRQKKVDILVWAPWRILNKQMEPAFEQLAKWGIKGVKVDFMERDDQEMVRFYERTAATAAKYQMMVDFHGSHKPTGWLRSYPNVVTSEGVFGMEMAKFYNEAERIVPNNVTIPFIRMAAGPMDYTPGGMNNVQKGRFQAIRDEPMVPGTRCHHLAMYVIYESPLQMLSDSPLTYEKEAGSFEFLKQVPTVWKQTVPLQSKVGEYVVIARQAPNDDWYIGGMTDWNAREFTIGLDFLGEGSYRIQVWKDGVNANRSAKDVKIESFNVNKNTKLDIQMTTGGGFAARITRP